MTFAEATDNWLSDRREHISAPSVDRYEYLMGKYIMGEFGRQDIESITLAQIMTYISDIADKERHGDTAISGSTMETLQSITGNVITFAKKSELKGMAKRNAESLKKNSYKTLSGAEIEKLITFAKYNINPEVLAVLLSLYTGIGIGEICAL